MGYISVHLHPPTQEFLDGYSTALARMAGSLNAENRRRAAIPIEAFVEDMVKHDIERAVILPIDARTAYRDEWVPNEYVARVVNAYPDRVLGFASVDPNMGAEAIKALDHAILELKLTGLKLDATKQGWDPSDRRYYPLFERVQELSVPVTFHTGWSPGFSLQFGNPVYYDNLANDFPEIRMNLAHFGWPWAEECMAVAWNRRNVFFDLAAWRPSYIPPNVVHFVNTVNQDKALFSHDFPVLKTSAILEEFHQLNLKPTVVDKVTRLNAVRFLGLQA
jgi:predicted TIM-barrel fold metal-dependent hydrolase